jgi:hypothetical protein
VTVEAWLGAPRLKILGTVGRPDPNHDRQILVDGQIAPARPGDREARFRYG